MNSSTIQKLRVKIIVVSAGSIFLAMLFLGVLINLSSFMTIRQTMNTLLDFIIVSDGELDNIEEEVAESEYEDFAPEFKFSTRYFSVIYDDSGQITDKNTSHIAAVDEKTAEELARTVLTLDDTFGRIDSFYYKTGETSDGQHILVLIDASERINEFNSLLRMTILIGIAGLMVTLVLVTILSKRAIQPEIENNQRQRQFITNASHELKTPLAVIRANTEILEMMYGENEWTTSNMRQIDRMDGLIKNLVMITRSQELEDHMSVSRIDVSKAVAESAASFDAMAARNSLQIIKDIPEDIQMVADDSKIRQLTSILMDNAIKYCDDLGTISITLASEGKGRGIRLTISNSYADGSAAKTSRFFDRFYRDDSSHNIDRGGYGIGLSIAQSICHQYRGSIRAVWKNGVIFFYCVLMQPIGTGKKQKKG